MLEMQPMTGWLDGLPAGDPRQEGGVIYPHVLLKHIAPSPVRPQTHEDQSGVFSLDFVFRKICDCKKLRLLSVVLCLE